MEINGFININKPVGLSSFQVVRQLRKITNVQKIGHAGTLDPFASGVLVIAIGRSFTRQIENVQKEIKKYVVSMVCGIETDTLDSFGKITEIKNCTLSSEIIYTSFKKFIGKYEQIPPQFSAKKINGKRAYNLARNGEFAKLEPKTVEIYDLQITKIIPHKYTIIEFEMTCSKGCYVRSLVRDVSREMNTVAYTKNLIRSEVGQFTILNAVKLKDLTLENIKTYLTLTLPGT